MRPGGTGEREQREGEAGHRHPAQGEEPDDRGDIASGANRDPGRRELRHPGACEHQREADEALAALEHPLGGEDDRRRDHGGPDDDHEERAQVQQVTQDG